MFPLEMSPIPLKPCLLVGMRENHREHQKFGAGRTQKVGSSHHFFVYVLPFFFLGKKKKKEKQNPLELTPLGKEDVFNMVTQVGLMLYKRQIFKLIT